MSVLILVFASAFAAAMFISLAGINIEIAFGTVATAAIWVFAAAAITRGRRGSATGIAASTVTIVGAAAALAGFTGEFAAADAIRRIFTGDRKAVDVVNQRFVHAKRAARGHHYRAQKRNPYNQFFPFSIFPLMPAAICRVRSIQSFAVSVVSGHNHDQNGQDYGERCDLILHCLFSKDCWFRHFHPKPWLRQT